MDSQIVLGGFVKVLIDTDKALQGMGMDFLWDGLFLIVSILLIMGNRRRMLWVLSIKESHIRGHSACPTPKFWHLETMRGEELMKPHCIIFQSGSYHPFIIIEKKCLCQMSGSLFSANIYTLFSFTTSQNQAYISQLGNTSFPWKTIEIWIALWIAYWMLFLTVSSFPSQTALLKVFRLITA